MRFNLFIVFITYKFSASKKLMEIQGGRGGGGIFELGNSGRRGSPTDKKIWAG